MLKTIILESIAKTANALGRLYLEAHYGKYLANVLRKMNVTVYEEYPVIYTVDGFNLGTGRIDLLCKKDSEVYILELKANVQCSSTAVLSKTINQCERYMKHLGLDSKGIAIFFSTNTSKSYKIIEI